MKIIRKPVKAIVECTLCDCEFEISGKDWRKVETSHVLDKKYSVLCPNCKHAKYIVPGEVRCKK